MDFLLSITWDMGRGIDLGFFTLRTYSLLFAGGFVLGYFIMKRIFNREGIPIEKLDTLLTYVVIATVVGARLGHVIFYQWDYYSNNLLEILMVWKGGLASHGAAIAIIIAMLIYARKELSKSPLWILDRVVITVAIAACFIRLGNLANSEIYGDVSNSAWEMVFTNPVRERIQATTEGLISDIEFIEKEEYQIEDDLTYPLYDLQFTFTEKVPSREAATKLIKDHVKPLLDRSSKEDLNMKIIGVEIAWDESERMQGSIEARGYPRSPTQIYEAIGYLIIFFILARLYLVADVRQRQGMLFGLFLILVFGFRIAIEFMKENQVSSEQGDGFNIGQSLSVPLVLVGLYFTFASKKLKK